MYTYIIVIIVMIIYDNTNDNNDIYIYIYVYITYIYAGRAPGGGSEPFCPQPKCALYDSDLVFSLSE